MQFSKAAGIPGIVMTRGWLTGWIRGDMWGKRECFRMQMLGMITVPIRPEYKSEGKYLSTFWRERVPGGTSLEPVGLL